MPGLAERQLYKAGSGLRNFQHMIFGSDADSAYFAAQLTGAPLTGLSVGDNLTQVATGLPLPRALTVKAVTDATVVTRSLTLRAHGEDQFGNYITEDLVTSNAASQTRVALGILVFAKVSVIEVIAVSGFVTGDAVDVGLNVAVAGQLNAQDVIYGLPVLVNGSTDILSATLLQAGALSGAIDGSTVTLVPGVHGVKLPVGAAPDSGNDRITILNGRTSV